LPGLKCDEPVVVVVGKAAGCGGEVEQREGGDTCEVEAVRVHGGLRGQPREGQIVEVGTVTRGQPQLGGGPQKVVGRVGVVVGAATEATLVVRRDQQWLDVCCSVGGAGGGEQLPGVGRIAWTKHACTLRGDRGEVQGRSGRRPVQHALGRVLVR
jgi:hypothetical protein